MIIPMTESGLATVHVLVLLIKKLIEAMDSYERNKHLDLYGKLFKLKGEPRRLSFF